MAKALQFRIPAILKACAMAGNLRRGKSVHGHILRSPLAADPFIGAAVLGFYSAAGDISAAAALFSSFPNPDTALWTAMITAYQRKSLPLEALTLFSTTIRNPNPSPSPNAVTLTVVVSAVTQIRASLWGKSAHGFALRHGFFLSDLPLANSLLNMYCKMGNEGYVGKIFGAIAAAGDVVTWTCVLGFFANSGRTSETLLLYIKMAASGVPINRSTVVVALQAAAASADSTAARTLHGQALRRGLESNSTARTAIVDAYMKCSDIDEAEALFSEMKSKDVVAWSALLGGFSLNGRPHQCFNVFRRMLAAGPPPDAVTMAKLLSGCSQLGLLCQAQCLHCLVFRLGFHRQPHVAGALVDLYGKCGGAQSAAAAFAEVEERDAAVWTALIGAYGANGLGLMAIQTFEEMLRSEAARPTAATLAAVFSACSHSGLLAEGKKVFREMEGVHGLTPGVDHTAAMVDLLGRGGELGLALELVRAAKSRDAWAALLASCRAHVDAGVAETAARGLAELGVQRAGPYLPLMEVLASSGRWGEMGEVRRLMKELGVVGKMPGLSTIEVGGEVRWFLAGD